MNALKRNRNKEYLKLMKHLKLETDIITHSRLGIK